MAQSIGKHKILCVTPNITIWSNPTTIYQRKNGTYYVNWDKRVTITKEKDHFLFSPKYGIKQGYYNE